MGGGRGGVGWIVSVLTSLSANAVLLMNLYNLAMAIPNMPVQSTMTIRSVGVRVERSFDEDICEGFPVDIDGTASTDASIVISAKVSIVVSVIVYQLLIVAVK